ncbi:hypothetical protein [Bradyrhizobium japonicum]|nr:hypothetical protein [Bradyrhizobium japonicum]
MHNLEHGLGEGDGVGVAEAGSARKSETNTRDIGSPPAMNGM